MSEWNHDGSVTGMHSGTRASPGSAALGARPECVYCAERPSTETDFLPEGWRWIDADDSDDSVLTFMRLRKGRHRPSRDRL